MHNINHSERLPYEKLAALGIDREKADSLPQEVKEKLASGAVSYTHLDVYKRQGVDNVCYQSNGSIAFSPVSGGKTIFFPIDGNVDFYSYYPQTTVNDYKVALDVTDQTKQETIDFMYAKTCLLYTSRFV